jgi:pseudaminic acid synthase
MNSFYVDNRKIGEDAECFIIAEMSANHCGDFDIAVKTIKAMKKAGADAVKLQTYSPDSMTLDSDKPWFQTRKETIWSGQKLYDLFKKGQTPWEWHTKLQEVAHNEGLIFFSSPFEPEAIDLLEGISVPAYKIASPEINDIPLIRKAAKTGKPIIISSGVAKEEDITLALEVCKEEGNQQIAILKCTSAYPAPLEEINLNAIPFLKEEYNVVAGLSDHTLGITVPVAAVAVGAKILEKHFILDKSLDSVDRTFSLNPNEFKQMVGAVRQAEKALGKPTLEPTEKSILARASMRSLYAIEDIKAGEEITSENIKSLRPNKGLQPKFYNDLIGKIALKDIEKGTPLSFDLFE